MLNNDPHAFGTHEGWPPERLGKRPVERIGRLVGHDAIERDLALATEATNWPAV